MCCNVAKNNVVTIIHVSVSFNNELIMNAELMAGLTDTEHAAVIFAAAAATPLTVPQLLLLPCVRLLLSI